MFLRAKRSRFAVSLILLFQIALTWAFCGKDKCHDIPRLFTRLRLAHKQSQEALNKEPASWIPPLLAVVTLPTACDSIESVQQTVTALKAASADSENRIHVVYVRVPCPDAHDKSGESETFLLLLQLLEQLQSVDVRGKTKIFISSEWALVPTIWTRIQHVVDGIHVKERHVEQIQTLQQNSVHASGIPMGTSVHSIEAAVKAWECIQPIYFFVGTCYPTASHPEKSSTTVEGPALPGQVATTLHHSVVQGSDNQRPAVFAIGGIDASNCYEPVQVYGADGVAVIRAVMKAENPKDAVRTIYKHMRQDG